ncbi:synapsin-1-like [Pollicipes pollicipes]|uniref:synapsin-1-like n=1 Tax=Pollicipes pollicipes TaxID=41117 RepID=UPI001885098C|nr:synapsin-1-like [Pollicipes pollicipes]
MSNYRGGRRSQATSEEARTPIAWQHRDLNYQQQGYSDRYRTDHIRRGAGSVSDQTSNTERSSRTKRSTREAPPVQYRGRPPPDSESTSGSSESSQGTKVPTHAGPGGPALHLVPVSGGGPPTIRSAQSVPLLLPGPAGPLTWDGEPCPVHHHPPPPLPVGCGGLKKVLVISLAVVVLGVILAVALIFIIN